MTIEAIDMRSQFPNARDQGARPTCLAFAMSDAHMIAASRPGLLAPEYLHFHAARRASVSLNAAVGLTSTRDALENDGQPLENECPYAATREESWTPPSKFSAIWTRTSTPLVGKASEILTIALLAKRADVLVLRISRSFHAPDPTLHVVHEDGGKDRRLHAVVIVGMAPVAGTTSFLARNSWGTEWGEDGYAWLPSSYVDARAIEIVELEAQE
jgi:hypothetical protein